MSGRRELEEAVINTIAREAVNKPKNIVLRILSRLVQGFLVVGVFSPHDVEKVAFNLYVEHGANHPYVESVLREIFPGKEFQYRRQNALRQARARHKALMILQEKQRNNRE